MPSLVRISCSPLARSLVKIRNAFFMLLMKNTPFKESITMRLKTVKIQKNDSKKPPQAETKKRMFYNLYQFENGTDSFYQNFTLAVQSELHVCM